MSMSEEFIDQALKGGGNPILQLLRVTFEGEVYHFADNTEDVPSSVTGTPQVYRRGSFKIDLPDDTEEGTPKATLKLEATDSRVIRALRSSDSPAVFDIWLVLGDNPDIVEYGPINYKATSFTIEDKAISLSLEVEPILQVSVPSVRYTPNTFRGLFKS